MKSPYPGYNVLDEFPHWDAQTQRVVLDRIHNVPPYTFFEANEARLLEAVAERIIPQDDRAPEQQVPVAPFIDEMLAKDQTEGYRQPDMPWAQEAWRKGLTGIEETSNALTGLRFIELSHDERDRVLNAIQRGDPPGKTWQRLPAKQFFKQLVEQTAAVYYSNPTAWSEIGWGGPASPRGYVRTLYGMRDPWEPEEKGAVSSIPIVRRKREDGSAGGTGGATH